jgi:uncharacterized repeat protein (TIGR02543 family)
MNRRRWLCYAITVALLITAVFALPMTASANETENSVSASAVQQGDIVYYGSYPKTYVSAPAGAPGSPANGQVYETGGEKYIYVDVDEYGAYNEFGFRSDDATLFDGWYRYEPIAWRVLANADGKLFLLAEEVLDNKPYHEEGAEGHEAVTWETSTARSWLNGYDAASNFGTNNSKDGAEGNDYTNNNFLDTAFTPEEQSFIAETTLDNPDNPNFETSGGNATTDKVFYLKLSDTINAAYAEAFDPAWPVSTDPGNIEADNIAYHNGGNWPTPTFPNTRAAKATDYAKANGVYYYTDPPAGYNYDPNDTWRPPVGYCNGNASWRLRSPGMVSILATRVDIDGSVDFWGEIGGGGDNASAMGAWGVRPALYLTNLESLNLTLAPAPVTVTFNANGGKEIATRNVEKNTAIGALPTTSRTGYSFLGWYTEADGGTKITETTVVTDNVTYHAHWSANSRPPSGPSEPSQPAEPAEPSQPPISNGWQKQTDGTWKYYTNGTTKTGWQIISNKWYYLGTSDGIMKTGWNKVGSSWYLHHSKGHMLTGWQKSGGKWYYLMPSGAMKTGWVKDANKWYYLDATGKMLTGWQKVNGTWYYLNASGKMLTGTQKIGSKTYRFSSSGAWIA